MNYEQRSSRASELPADLQSSVDPQFPSTAEDHANHKEIPSNAKRSGAASDHLHDITKAERALHEGLRQGRIEEGDTVSGDGDAPGGPTHLPK